MYRPKQISFPGYAKSQTSFGGSLHQGRRKTARPICAKKSLHVVLRSEIARGEWYLLLPANAKLLKQLLTLYSLRFSVTIYSFANVGNHCHLLLRAKSKEGLRNFLRVFAGQLAQRITGTRPGKPLKTSFWSVIAFSRIVEWGRGFATAKNYLFKNVQQAAVSIRYSPISRPKHPEYGFPCIRQLAT